MKPHKNERAIGLHEGLLLGIASPAFAMLGQAAHAQEQSTATELSPIKVVGEKPAPFLVDESASGKFTAPVLDTAKTLQIIPQELIESQAATTLTEVLRNSPGITFGAGEGGNPLGDRPFIRGYDAQSSTFIDGMRDIGATSREVFNLEQVEVIKGPDGALAGRGGAGGSIDLISKSAQLRDFSDISLGAGSAFYGRATVDSNWQLGDSTAIRLNAMRHTQEVDGRDGVKYSRWGVAPTISFGLGTATRVSLSHYHLESNDTPDSGIPYTLPGGSAMREPAAVSRSNFYGLDSDYRRNRSDMTTLLAEHDFNENLSLRNRSRYSLGTQKYVVTQPDDSKGNVNKGLVWRRVNTRDSRVETWANQTELQGELQLAGMRHRFLAGVEISQEKSRRDSLLVDRAAGDPQASCPGGAGAGSNYHCTSLYQPYPGDPWVNSLNGGAAGTPTHTKTDTKSVYFFDTIEFDPQWQANFGLRLDDYRTSLQAFGADRVSRHDTLFNYQLGLVYKPAENGSVYVSYGTSSTPAGATLGEGSETQGLTPGRGGVGPNAADMAPEKTRSLELGTKWELLDGTLALNAAVFRIETTNARVTLANGDYAMAGKRKVDGIELGFSGALTEQWQVYGGYAWLKGRVGENGANSAYEGNALPNTPEHSFSLWSSYRFSEQLSAGIGAYYVAAQYGNDANTIRVPSYWKLDAMLGWRFNKNVDLQLNLNNLTDRTYYETAYASHYATPAPGRSALATLNLHF